MRGESGADLGAVGVIIIEANGVIDVMNGAKGERKAKKGKIIGGKGKNGVENGAQGMRRDVVIGGNGAKVIVVVIDDCVANGEGSEMIGGRVKRGDGGVNRVEVGRDVERSVGHGNIIA